MSPATSGPFLGEAHRLGRQLAGSALRYRNRATWLADTCDDRDGYWRPSVATLGGELGTGTAGVSLFLSRLSRCTDDPLVRTVAVEAMWHALHHARRPMEAGEFGWFNGGCGIACAASSVGRELGDEALEAAGQALARRCTEVARQRAPAAAGVGLVGGLAGTVAGFLSIAVTLGDAEALELAGEGAALIATLASDDGAVPGGGSIESDPSRVGLARGHSGSALVMAAWSAVSGDVSAGSVAETLFGRESAWLEPAARWSGTAVEPWASHRTDLARSWYTGASGLGIARICAHPVCPDRLLLAEAGSCVELIRTFVERSDAPDGSLCYGVGGEIELLLLAGTVLAEEAHVRAARRVGLEWLARVGAAGRYGCAFGPDARNPSLLHGLAGCGLTLLRLFDPTGVPSPAVPPCMPERAIGRRAARTLQ